MVLRTGKLPKNTPYSVYESITEAARLIRQRKFQTRVCHVSHTSDNTLSKEETQRRKTLMNQRYGGQAQRIAQGNAAADALAKQATKEPSPTITYESTALPRFLPVDSGGRLIPNVNKHIRVAFLKECRKRLDRDGHYTWRQSDTNWKLSAQLGKSRDTALCRIQNFAIRARRGLFPNKVSMLIRKPQEHWVRRYGKALLNVENDKCDSCSEQEERFHFITCRTHNRARKEITEAVLAYLNDHTQECVTEVPVYWAAEQKRAGADGKWQEVENRKPELAAMGLIPQPFVEYLTSLKWKSGANLCAIIAEIQIIVVHGLMRCWQARCKKFFEVHNPRNSTEQIIAKLEIRTKRREEPQQKSRDPRWAQAESEKPTKRPRRKPPDKR